MIDACQVCGSPAHARLCDVHRDDLAEALRQLADHVDRVRVEAVPTPGVKRGEWPTRQIEDMAQGLYGDLVDTAYRLDNTGPSGVPVTCGEITEVTHNSRAAAVRDHVRNAIGTWARDLAETHPHLTLPTTVPAAAAWMATLAELLAQHPAAGEIHRDIVPLPKRILDVVQPPDLTYLGICSANTGGTQCPADLFADRDDDRPMTQCRRCGAWWEISARREWMLRAMEDQLLTAEAMRTALTRYMPAGVPRASTIRWWASIGKLAQKPPHPAHPTAMRYRVGDVLDLIAARVRQGA